MQSKTISIILLVILFILLFSLGYFIGNNQNYKKQLDDQTRTQNNIQPAHNYINYKFNLKEKKLIINNIDTIENFRGISMQPTFFTGNRLIQEKYNESAYALKEGDIIGYSNEDNGIIIHRIKGIYYNYIIMQGDHNYESEKINYSQVKYIVKGVLYA